MHNNYFESTCGILNPHPTCVNILFDRIIFDCNYLFLPEYITYHIIQMA